MRTAFELDPAVTHLNHGSYGAVPRVVAEAQQYWRRRAEANPMRFFKVESAGLKERARVVSADLLDVAPDEVALLRNPTQAVGVVLSSLAAQGRLGPGDVIVLASPGYESVRRSVAVWCERTGATYDVVDVPVDAAAGEIAAAFERAFTSIDERGGRVRLVVVDHITSPTGAVLPVREISAAARRAGALTLVDAAHSPGHVVAHPAETGADFWTGTWHKWGFAPRGTSALWVAEPERDGVVPFSTSWNSHLDFPLPFDVQGTDDFSGWYALEAAADFWREVGGLDIAKRADALLDEAVAVLRAALPLVDAPLPQDPAPCMRLVPLPDGVADTDERALALYERLSALGVEAQTVAHAGRGWIRLSATVYNELADYERLAEVLPAAIASEGPSGA